jgi:hypothetical protein
MKRTRPQLERSREHGTGDREPFVTYSRLEADQLDPPQGVHEFDDDGPLYDAVEVPHIERPRSRDAFDSRLDIRAERPADDFDPLEPERRPRRIRYLVIVGLGVIAVLAGVGVLLSSVGSSSRVETTAGDPAPAVTAAPEDEGAAVDAGRTVREIPLGNGLATPGDDIPAADTAAISEPTAPVEPPTPRVRPDAPTTVSVETETPATGDAPVTDALAAPAGEDDFISRIEQTLSRIDDGSEAPAAVPAPPVSDVPAADTVAPVMPEPVGEEPIEVLRDEDVLPVGEDFIFDGEAMTVDPGAQSVAEPLQSQLPVPPGADATPPASDEPMPLFEDLLSDPTVPVDTTPQQFIPPADIPGATPSAPLN